MATDRSEFQSCVLQRIHSKFDLIDYSVSFLFVSMRNCLMIAHKWSIKNQVILFVGTGNCQLWNEVSCCQLNESFPSSENIGFEYRVASNYRRRSLVYQTAWNTIFVVFSCSKWVFMAPIASVWLIQQTYRISTSQTSKLLSIHQTNG